MHNYFKSADARVAELHKIITCVALGVNWGTFHLRPCRGRQTLWCSETLSTSALSWRVHSRDSALGRTNPLCTDCCITARITGAV